MQQAPQILDLFFLIVGGWRHLCPMTDATWIQISSCLVLKCTLTCVLQPDMDIAMQFLYSFEEADIPISPGELRVTVRRREYWEC
jgi:hypothetical protein